MIVKFIYGYTVNGTPLTDTSKYEDAYVKLTDGVLTVYQRTAQQNCYNAVAYFSEWLTAEVS